MSNNIIIPNELIEKLKEQRCIAFIGAGLSIGAGLPDWYILLEQMITWCEKHNIDLPNRNDLEDLLEKEKYLILADILIDVMGKSRYHQFLKEVFRRVNLKPTETHKLLPQIPFSAILTSNYDKLLEGVYAAFSEGTIPQTFTHLDTSELSVTLQNNAFHILKTHGDIDRVESIVLGKHQYRELLHNNSAYKIYLQNVLASKTVLFLGFSLTDPDLFSILDELSVAFKGNTSPHYALMDSTKLNSLEIDRFRRDYNINIIPYIPSDNIHPEVPEFLHELINRTPKKSQVYLEKAKIDLENVDSHYKFVGNTAGEYTLHEKYFGAAKEKPINVDLKFLFDTKTEEGKNALENLKRMLDTGEEVTLTEEFLTKAEIPEIFQKAFSGKFKTTKIMMGSHPSDLKFNVNLVVDSNKGNTAKIENIILDNIRSGIKVSVFNNEKQKHSFQLTVEFPVEEGELETKVKFGYNPFNTNVKQAFEVENFLSVLAEGGEFFFENSNTGVSFASAEIPPCMVVASHPLWLEMLEKLTFIQRKTKILFLIPEEIKEDDIRAIREVFFILKEGKGSCNFSVEATMDKKAVENILEDKFSGEIVNLTEQTYIILGKHIPMGQLYYSCKKVEVSEETKERLAKELKDESKESFNLILQSAKKHPTEVFYLNFLSEEEFEKLHEDKVFRQYSLKNIVEILFETSGYKDEDSGIDQELLLSLFKDTKEQKNSFGKPLNMLGRCTKEELKEALERFSTLIENKVKQKLLNFVI